MFSYIANWFQLGPIPNDVIYGYFNYGLVALSYFVAVMASYVALDLAGRVRAEPKHSRAKLYWLLGGAFAMGAGIWSMHFVGMLAFVMPMAMTYEFYWTGGSMLVAILAAGFALYLLGWEERQTKSLVLGGIVLGFGIAMMHYTGMEAMREHVRIHYLPGLFLISLLIAIVASEAALWLVLQSNKGSYKRQIQLKIGSALVMGAAICGMHYTGMAAAVFTPHLQHIMTSGMDINIEPHMLAFYIVGITGSIITIALLVSTYKQLMVSAVQNEKNFLNAMLDNIEDGIIACDAKGVVTLVNQSLEKKLNLSKNVKLTKELWNSFDLHPIDTKTNIVKENKPLARALQGEKIQAMELEMVLKNSVVRNIVMDGQPIINPEGKKLGAVIVLHDITERKVMEKQLVRQATHDMLTGLPNRTLLMDRITQAINVAKRNKTLIALLFLDFDEFKLVNDTLGHSSGDKLLINAADRLKANVREADTLARLGGDEFVILLEGVTTEGYAGVVAQKISNALTKPFEISGHEIKSTVSIGISVYPKDGETADELLKNADTAMYRAKAEGRNAFKYHSEEMNTKTLKRLELEQNLYQALERKEFMLYYQPIVDIKSGYIIGAEALLRWQHPTKGLILPIDIIPSAEETGLIVPLGEWVLRTACQQNKAWQAEKLNPIHISVNVSSVQFKNSDFVATVKKILAETKLEPKYLELELTESVIVDNPSEIINYLRELKNLGINISLDDFGTGYSSLSYLRRLPVDKLKIDKSFVQELGKSSDNSSIVLAIIALATSMKLKVIAEGMETESQFGFLRFNHCDEVQGYYFSRPVPAEAFTKLLKENKKLMS